MLHVNNVFLPHACGESLLCMYSIQQYFKSAMQFNGLLKVCSYTVSAEMDRFAKRDLTHGFFQDFKYFNIIEV